MDSQQKQFLHIDLGGRLHWLLNSLLRLSYRIIMCWRYNPDMEKYILVVDDEPAILDSLQLVLEYEGYSVKASLKGDYVDKISAFPSNYPRLIILDMFLSGKDGRDIVQKLKRSPRTHDIPVMMISAYPQASSEAKRVGADDFISKPFEVNELLGKVRKFVH